MEKLRKEELRKSQDEAMKKAVEARKKHLADMRDR